LKTSRYGPAPFFDLEGCLEEFPIVAPELPESPRVPMWAIGAVVHNTGRRHPKLREKVYAGVSPGGYSPTGAWGPVQQKNWADQAWDPSTERSQRKHDRKKGKIEPRMAAWKVPPPGNLREDDYRFWLGSPLTGSSDSTCRWCANSAWNREQRVAHFTTGRQCNSKMLTVFKFALKKKTPICMVCAKTTWHKRWGVPLCNQPECIGKWKFGMLRFLEGWTKVREECRLAGFLDSFELSTSGV
jgi:hypothetical protein